MKTIQKQISLEPMTSRLPSIWPSYYDNKLYFFDDDSLKDREYLYTSNYGMIPLNIVLNHRPYPWNEDTFIPETCDDSIFTISFERLSKWYHFFIEYYNLLKRYGHCNRVYTSAEDYYNYESLTKYADQMIYGSEKQTYLDLDREFTERGGVVMVRVYNKDTSQYEVMTPQDAHDECEGDRMAMVDVYDIGFFNWICKYVVPSFEIPMMYREYWKRDVLYYPDVIRWLAWFEDRVHYENEADYQEGESGETELWDCKQSGVTDCCECEDYFNRGGKRIYDSMKSWYNGVQLALRNIAQSLSIGIEDCFIPKMILQTNLQTSLENLGENSIFSKDYELGIDYRTTTYGGSINTNGGTVATMDGNSIYLAKDEQGFSFNDEYMEKYVSHCRDCGHEGVFYDMCPKCGGKHIEQCSGRMTNVWTSYTDKYISENISEFSTSFKKYTYDEYNRKHVGNDDNEVYNSLIKRYPLTTNENGWVLIEEVLYPIYKSEYAKQNKDNPYISGNTYFIFREEGTDTPYTYINGNKTYGEFYPITNTFYFSFFTNDDANFERDCSGLIFNINNYKQFGRHKSQNEEDYKYYIEYNGTYYVLDGNPSSTEEYTINNNSFHRVKGYNINEYGDTLYWITSSGENRVVSYQLIPSQPSEDDDSHTMAVYALNDYTIEGYNDPTIDEANNDIVFTPIRGNGSIYTIYDVDMITGQSVSHLYDLRSYNLLTDDIGNTIEGLYNLRKFGNNVKNHQPKEGEELEPIYQVGNTANIKRFHMTMEDEDEVRIQGNVNYFVGDIITDMTFYYRTYGNEIVNETIVSVTLDENTGVPSQTSLEAIKQSTTKKEELEEEGNFMYDDIYCDITYYIGATLSRRDNRYFIDFDHHNYGVQYNETVRFVKENREYYLKKPKKILSVLPSKRHNPCVHSVSYPIVVYVLKQEMVRVENSQYDADYRVAMADFITHINLIDENCEDSYTSDMATHNNMQVFPTFMEEYKIGTSVIENIDSDIYIDRGINAAFEKHIKLGEVKSLEALEQYGNSYFKMMES